MHHRHMLSSALATALALGFASQAAGQTKPKEKCYGISKAGTNDCGNLAGTHTCAGQSRSDFHHGDWRYVPKGTCRELKGLSEDEAKVRDKEQRPA